MICWYPPTAVASETFRDAVRATRPDVGRPVNDHGGEGVPGGSGAAWMLRAGCDHRTGLSCGSCG